MNGELAIVVALSSIIGAFIGYIGAIATFRAQFTTVNVRHDALVEQISRDRAADKANMELQVKYLTDTLSRIERQSIATLRLVANIAHKTGVERRALGEDLLTRFLEDTEENGK